jgi:hypothetical protein
MLGKLSPDSTSHNFITPPTPCQSLCLDQAVRTIMLVSMPLMDNIGIAMIQRGDESQGLWITGADTAGGQGGANTAPIPSKSKGKVVRTIRIDDEVSSDDDILLQRPMRAFGSSGSVTGRLPVMGQKVPIAATGLPLDPSMVVERKTTDYAATVKKAMYDDVVVKKAADDTAVKKKTVDDTAEAKKAAAGSSSPLVLAAGSKRAIAPSGSTPPAKRPFLGHWKPHPAA